jgi:lipopolysaccharide transport system permease protein
VDKNESDAMSTTVMDVKEPIQETKNTNSQTPLMVITPSRKRDVINFRELWQYRDLLYILAQRDVSVRYKQAALGVIWVILQPLFQMVIFTVIFSRVAKLPSDNMPYELFCFAALIPWQLFAGALTRAGQSLVTSSNLITKVYFPRLIIPFSSLGACLVDFAISLLILAGLFIWDGVMTPWRFTPGWPLLTLPLFIVLDILTALAVSLWLSALNVRYRDIGQTIPFLVQIWMYASPVAYSTSLVPPGIWRMLYNLNPMAGVIQGFRWALLGGPSPEPSLAISVAMVFVLLLGGLYFFRRMEKTFADVV